MENKALSNSTLWQLFCLQQSAEVHGAPEAAKLCSALALVEALGHQEIRLYYETNDPEGGLSEGLASTHGDWIVLQHEIRTGIDSGMKLNRRIVLSVQNLDPVPAIRSFKIAAAMNRVRHKQKRRDFSRPGAEKIDDYASAIADLVSWTKILDAFLVYTQHSPQMKYLYQKLWKLKEAEKAG